MYYTYKDSNNKPKPKTPSTSSMGDKSC